ncbi:MAG: cytosine permease [Thermoproteota archaeon]|nr:cytosine permease [Thermoproteota archaeon]
MVLLRIPEWGINPVPDKHKVLGGLDYFILWSSLGVGLLVLSAGSFLSKASFLDAIFAVIIGSAGGSILLALAGKIGSDHGVPSLITMRPAFGIRGSYLPAILNILQLIGWTTFEIMIMARAADMLAGGMIPYYFWAAIFGILVALLGIAGPLNVARQWIGKFAVWIAYGTSAIIIINLISSTDITALISSPGEGLSFFSALDLVIAMPVSWMPLVADYNRFSKKSKSALWGTFIGFMMTNILFYFGGILLGTSDILGIVTAIQAMFFGFLMLLLIVDEADNAFADIYSASVSAQNIFQKISQKHLVVGFTVLSAILAMVVSIEQYEVFLLLIGAIFVPLFGVVLTDYYIVKRQKYTEQMLYVHKDRLGIGVPAMIAWALGAILNYLLSPLSPIYMEQLPAIGATIPSLAAGSLVYLAITMVQRRRRGEVMAQV